MVSSQTVRPSELAEARAKLYQLLGSAYIRPPDRDFLRLLAGWVTSQIGGLSPLLSEQVKQGLTTLDDFFKKVGENSWVKLEEAVSVEFTRLFRGVSPIYSPPPPYESVYREESGRVFSDLTFQVYQAYRHFGLDLANSFSHEPPDHISFELEFMRLLCHREAEAWHKGDEDEAGGFLWAEEQFVTEHLGTWLPELCGRIREQDRLGLFRGLADLTEGWVVFDYEEHLKGRRQPGEKQVE